MLIAYPTFHGVIANVIFIGDQAVQIDEALLRTSQYVIPESIDSINKLLRLEIEEIGKAIKEFPEYSELYQDIMSICSLNLITIDASEYQKNCGIFGKFITKYGDIVVT